jgi:hypothetical protein
VAIGIKPAAEKRLLWGWLRLVLGFAQIAFVGLSIGALFAVGLKPLTWVFVICATALTLMSRLIYRGRPTPNK